MGTRSRKSRVDTLRLSASAIVLAVASPAMAREQTHHISISARPLGGALIDLAIQADISIATPPGFGDARSAALSGDLSAEEALSRLLAGTGYSFERIDAVTFRIVAAQHAVQRSAASQSDTIIVTAHRRPETLARAAASASAISAAQLDQLGARESEDLAPLASGLSFTNLGPGRDKIILRGLSDGAFSGRTESTVSVYLDDSRITYGAPNPDLALVDVSSVEILRGPQGALYGGGSIGGVFHIVTNTPSFDSFSGSVSGGGELIQDRDIGNSVSGYVNIPLAPNQIAARLVAYRDVFAGWLDNPGLNLNDTNSTTRQGARLTVAARVTPSWTVSVNGLYQSLDSRDSQYTSRASGDDVRTTNILEPHDNDFALGSISLRGPTPIGVFDSTTTYVRHGFDSRYDATGAFTANGVPASSLAAFDESNSVRFVIEEARLSSAASPFPWSIGTFLAFGRTREENLLTDNLQIAPRQDYASDRHDALRELALFGTIGWQITPRLSTELGLRLFRSDLGARATASGIDPGLSDNFSGHRHESGVTPDIQLSYQAGPNALYYAHINEGYRGGGFNTGAIAAFAGAPSAEPTRRYGSDRLWNAELGAKYILFDGSTHVRVAAFGQDWENIQTDQLIAAGLPFTGNVGNGRNYGVEAEGDYALSDRTTLTAHVTLSDQEVHANPRFPAPSDAGLPGAPRLLGGASYITHRALSFADMTLALDALYVGRADITFADSHKLEIGGYFTANARLSFGRGPWSASLYMDNVTDDTASTFSFGNPFKFGTADLVTPLRPRTFGAELRRDF